MKRSFHCRCWRLVVLALTCLACDAGATTYVSFQSGPWSSPATWSAKTPPQPGDTAYILGHAITLDCSASIAVLIIGDGMTGSLEFDAVGSARILEIVHRLEVRTGASLLSPYVGIASHHQLVVHGDLVNNGIVYLSRNSTLPCDLVFLGSQAQALSGGSSLFQVGFVRIAKGSDTASIRCEIPIQSSMGSWEWYRGRWIQALSTLQLIGSQHVGPECTVEAAEAGTLDLRTGDLVVEGRVYLQNSGYLDIGMEGQGSLILTGPASNPRFEMDGGVCTIHSGGIMIHRGQATIGAGLLSLSPQGLHGALPPGMPLLQVDSVGGLSMLGGMIRIIDPNVKPGANPDIDIQTTGTVEFLGGALTLGDNLSLNQSGSPFLIRSSVPVYQLSVQSGPREVEFLEPLEILHRLDLISGQVICSFGQIILEDSCLITRVEGSLSCPPTLRGTVSVSYTGMGPMTTGPELPTIPAEVVTLRVDVAQGLTLSQDLHITEALELSQGVFDNDGSGNTLTCSIGSGSRVLRKTGSLTAEPVYAMPPILEYAGTGPMDMGPELPSSGFIASMFVNHSGTISFRQDLRIRDSLVLLVGNLDLGPWTVVLDVGALWSESTSTDVVTSGGRILTDLDLVGGYMQNLAGLGLDLEQPYGNCGWSRIVRTHEAPMIGSHPGLSRVVSIESSDSPQPVLATLHFNGHDRGSSSGFQLMGYVSLDNGNTWQVDPGSVVDTLSGTITYSEWTAPVMFTAGRIQMHPVELVTFTGRLLGNSRIRLQWRTATELNCDRFVVERRLGEAWQERGIQVGCGTCFSPRDYLFEDELGSIPRGGVDYRLRQIDRDGTEHLSPEIQIDAMRGLEPVLGPIFPTCAEEELYCRLPDEDWQALDVLIVDPLGRCVEVIPSSRVGKVGDFLILPVRSLKPGMYLLSISGMHREQAVRVQQMFLKR